MHDLPAGESCQEIRVSVPHDCCCPPTIRLHPSAPRSLTIIIWGQKSWWLPVCPSCSRRKIITMRASRSTDKTKEKNENTWRGTSGRLRPHDAILHSLPISGFQLFRQSSFNHQLNLLIWNDIWSIKYQMNCPHAWCYNGCWQPVWLLQIYARY